MTGFRTWHLLLVPLPIVGWLLLLAYLLDEWRPPDAVADRAATHPTRSRRVAAGGIDAGAVVLVLVLLPPSAAWLLGAVYVLFRDAGDGRYSLGKRVMKARFAATATASFTDSFERNLPLLFPFAGPLAEASLFACGRGRLGDRIARAR